jgi:hypothetical protein
VMPSEKMVWPGSRECDKDAAVGSMVTGNVDGDGDDLLGVGGAGMDSEDVVVECEAVFVASILMELLVLLMISPLQLAIIGITVAA